MKKFFKSGFTLFLCVAVLLNLNLFASAANSADEPEILTEIMPMGIDEVYSDNQYGDFSLIWENNGSRDLLAEASDADITATYRYDDEENRTQKTVNDVSTFFIYEEGLLIEEIRDAICINYIYDQNEDMIGFTYNENIYHFAKDMDRNVTGITLNDEQIVEYEYENGLVITVWMIEEGVWSDCTDVSGCIGNINMIRMGGYYFDAETLWYYCGRYYDTIGEQFVDGNSRLFRPFTVPSGILTQIELDYNDYITSSYFGKPLDYATGWYTSLGTVEILARLIYGENTSIYDDQKGVTWVIMNRYYANSSTFGTTLRDIATKSGQFEPITSGSDGTYNARRPNTTSTGWKNAVMLAVKICTTTNQTYLLELIPKPVGIGTQKYFVGLSYFFGTNPIVSQQGSTYIQYRFGATGAWNNIRLVTVVGYVNDTRDRSELNMIPNKSQYNVFFDLV